MDEPNQSNQNDNSLTIKQLNIEGKSMLEFKKPKEIRSPLKIVKNGEKNILNNNGIRNGKADQSSQTTEVINNSEMKKSKEEENIELKINNKGSKVKISPINDIDNQQASESSSSSNEEGINNYNKINRQLPKTDVDQKKINQSEKIMVRRSKGVVINKKPLNNKKIEITNNENSLNTNKNKKINKNNVKKFNPNEELEVKRRINELRSKLWKSEDNKDNNESEHHEEEKIKQMDINQGIRINKMNVNLKSMQHPKKNNNPSPRIQPIDAKQMGYHPPSVKSKHPVNSNNQNPPVVNSNPSPVPNNQIPSHPKPNKDIKVDLVYTWVNGSDIDFLNQMNMALKAINSSLKENEYTKARFADGDELKFSLRSVEKYFDWYNKIYIVTNGQIPSWLNTSNPRIKVITHQEIFLNKKDLPTFSSVAIESNIHRIPGLLEDFIYLNDDFMFSRKITWDDFFTPNGNHKIYLCWTSPRGNIDEKTDSYGNSMRHVNNLFDSKFGRRIRKVICHTPNYMKKSAIQELQNTFPEEYIKTSSHKFRANKDMQFVFSYYHYLRHTSKYHTSDLDPHNELLFRGVKEMSDKNFDIIKIIGSNKTKFLCIQDDLDYNRDVTKEKDYINKFYLQFFPKPSPFEVFTEESVVPSVLDGVNTSPSPSLSS